MVWLQFAFSAVVIVFAAIKLAEYGDVIAVRTKLSGMFIGTLLLAGATSLPELLSSLNALAVDAPDLAAGGMFGSSMFNMLTLAILDLLNQNARILRRVAMNHAMTASLANLMTGLVVFFILADLPAKLGWVGMDSLIIIVAYGVGIRIIQGNAAPPPPIPEEKNDEIPSLRRALLGFAGATAMLFVITPLLVRSADQIGTLTGLSAGFIGATLLAIVTSLPELVTTVAAVRFGAYDLAVGNLFGSNIFNMFALGLTDLFYFDGHFISEINPTFALAGLLALLLTGLALIGNLARIERRLKYVEIDALVIFIGYLAGMFFLSIRGIGV